MLYCLFVISWNCITWVGILSFLNPEDIQILSKLLVLGSVGYHLMLNCCCESCQYAETLIPWFQILIHNMDMYFLET